MSKRPAKPAKATTALPTDYATLLVDIKAGLAANRELLALYWEIGRLISEAQRAKGYGKLLPCKRPDMEVDRKRDKSLAAFL